MAVFFENLVVIDEYKSGIQIYCTYKFLVCLISYITRQKLLTTMNMLQWINIQLLFEANMRSNVWNVFQQARWTNKTVGQTLLRFQEDSWSLLTLLSWFYNVGVKIFLLWTLPSFVSWLYLRFVSLELSLHF